MSSRVSELWSQWHYFNGRFFGGKLRPPRVIRITSARSYDGYIVYDPVRTHRPVGIYLSTHQSRAAMTGTLLHEMVHQYQREVLGLRELDHGPVFRGLAKHIEQRTKFIVRVNRLG